MRRASERIFGVVFERENMLSVSVRKYEERNIMKTTLLIMAAGIGSRFGTGIKQLEPVDASNRIIMDYSIHDAIEAGFNHVVFIIRKDIEKEFKEVIGDRIAAICADHQVTVDYAFQDSNDIPGTLPEGRTKPWGTGQAVLAAKNILSTPFIVINADDYYGKEGFRAVHEYLVNGGKSCMAGFVLKNTLSDNGGVTRGICKMDVHIIFHVLSVLSRHTVPSLTLQLIHPSFLFPNNCLLHPANHMDFPGSQFQQIYKVFPLMQHLTEIFPHSSPMLSYEHLNQ